MEEKYKYTRGPYSGPMPPKREPTPNELALAKQNEVVRSELTAKRNDDVGEKESKDDKQGEINAVIREEKRRGGDISGKKPNLDFYDNKRDVKSGPGDKNPPYSGKFGTSYHDDREHN